VEPDGEVWCATGLLPVIKGTADIRKRGLMEVAGRIVSASRNRFGRPAPVEAQITETDAVDFLPSGLIVGCALMCVLIR
jgi:hypothetical protein